MSYFYRLIVSAIVSYVLLKYVFPKVIYWMCEAILILNEVIDYCGDEKSNWTNCLLTRLFCSCIFVFAWGIMLTVFIPMQILTYIEVLGGFVDKKILEEE